MKNISYDSQKNAYGLTLLELLISLVIIAVLLGIGIPSLASIIHKKRSSYLYNTIFTHIQYTRALAVNNSQDTIFCPSIDTINCINDWQKPLIIFIDKNSNQIRDNNELIDQNVNILHQQEKFIWKAFGTSRYIRYQRDGSTGYQNGNFSICSTIKKKAYIKQIKIYKSGRARRSNTDEIRANSCEE